nr:ThuA domain-containing protein [Gemmatales bacterium]
EFIVHGEQFKATMKVSSDFRAIQGLQDFDMHEEWYSLKNFSKDLHVILAQDSSTATESWKQSGNPKRVQGGNAFHIRPLHPATWARQHGKGRVFYTSMGHREDVWTNDIFQKVFLGGLNWVFRQVDADITPNIDQVTPQASVLRS